jgi:hypothetical protein
MPCLLTRLAQGLTDPENQILVQSIFGTVDPAALVQLIQQACALYSKHDITICEFWEVSVSFTVGLQLANSERIVVKFRSPENMTLATLQAICQIQQEFAAHGFPAPKILLMPIQTASCFVSIEQLLDVGVNGDAHDLEIRQAMAAGLAQQIQLTQALTREANLTSLPRSRFHPTQLWEKPHSALFDFEQTAAGAAWIDEIAAQSQQVLRTYEAPLLIGHMDWSVKNMRFQNHRLSTVYDWDSLRRENELVILGNAAKGFLTTWYLDVNVVPTPAESERFIRDYEAARTIPFTAAERQVIQAALLYSMAYTARCEHALDPAGAKLAGSFRAGLQEHTKTIRLI